MSDLSTKCPSSDESSPAARAKVSWLREAARLKLRVGLVDQGELVEVGTLAASRDDRCMYFESEVHGSSPCVVWLDDEDDVGSLVPMTTERWDRWHLVQALRHAWWSSLTTGALRAVVSAASVDVGRVVFDPRHPPRSSSKLVDDSDAAEAAVIEGDAT